MARRDASRAQSLKQCICKVVPALLAAALLNGCTTGSRSTVDTFRLITHRPAQATAEGVASNRFPQMQVRTPDIAAIAVLGYVDDGRQQWFAGSHAVFEMDRDGVLLGFSGLGKQWHTHIVGPSPFDDLRKVTSPVTVVRRYDWVPAYQINVRATGTLSKGGLEQIDILGTQRILQRYDEQLQGGLEGRNVYWADPATGFIWKSRQHLAPGHVAELTQLRPYRPAKD